MNKRHLFFVFADFGLGGVQRKIVDVVNFLEDQNELKNVVPHIVVRLETDLNFAAYLQNKNVYLHTCPKLPIFRRFQSAIYSVYLGYLILKYKPVGILAFLQFSLIQLIPFKILFFWIHFRLVLGHDNILSFYNRKPHVKKVFPVWFIRFAYSFADDIIVQTQFAKKDLQKNYKISAQKIIVIPNWVVKIPFKKNQQKMYDLMYCGRFAEQKKLDRLLAVVALVKKEKKNISLCLLGAGSEERKIRAFIKQNGLEKNVVIKPPSHFVYEELEKSWLFTLTSEFEGQPMALLEAMMLEVVPVVLEYPGVDEYIQNEKNGFIEETEKKMAKRIVFLLQNDSERKKIGKKARQFVLKNNNELLIEKTVYVVLGER